MYRYVWKINLYDPSNEQAFIDHWRANSNILQTYPGAQGSHIHRVRDEPGSFLMVAEWESMEARDAMRHDVDHGGSERARRWRALPKSDGYGEIIKFAGTQFDEVLLSDDRKRAG
jgi:quinol monooxygenase YgiN